MRFKQKKRLKEKNGIQAEKENKGEK